MNPSAQVESDASAPHGSYDLAVVNARLVTPGGVTHGGLAIDSGRILRLFAAGETPDAGRILDAQGLYVLPGLVDSHVHFRTPGLTHKEDWAHGSRAAAVGGVTTVIDMPNTDPPLLDLMGGEQRAKLVAGQSLVDFRFHPGVAESSAGRLAERDVGSAVTIKVFMTGHQTAPHVIRDAGVLAYVFRQAARAGLRVLIHAEDDSVFALLDSARDRDHDSSTTDYELVRPRSGGIVAVAQVIALVRQHGTAVHVLHVSTAEEVDLLSAAAKVGLPVTFEVTPHHLSFTTADVDRVGGWLRLSPAIRTDRDRERLWQAVVNGEASTIGSDHAPHTRQEKSQPGLSVPPGMPGVQEMLCAVHTELAARIATPDDRMRLIANMLAATPADLFGLSARKGRITAGQDADMVIFDPTSAWCVQESDVQSRCGWSAYNGRQMLGRPMITLRRGQVIWDSYTQTFGSPDGQYVPASPSVTRSVRTGGPM